jgi:hypothetical protein
MDSDLIGEYIDYMPNLRLEFLECRQISGVLKLRNPAMTGVYGLPHGELTRNL